MFFPKKKFGQNFLNSSSISKKIVDFSGISSKDFVLEIGPGKGILTEEILKRTSQILAVEIDGELIFVLNEKFRGKLKILNGDILKFDLRKIPVREFTVVGNLPFNISTAILKKFTLEGERIKSMTFMFQYEVAMRIVSNVGSGKYGSLTVFSNTFWEIEKGFKVSPGSFSPPPDVYSYVLKFHSFKNVIDSGERELFFNFLNRVFMFRRKKVSNTFKRNGYPLFILGELNIPFNVRPQDIPAKKYLQIFKKLKNLELFN